MLLLGRFLGCFLRVRRGRDGMAVVSSNAVYGELYSIQHYVIKIVSDLRQVGGFFRFPPPNKKTDSHDITEMVLTVALTL